MAMADGAGDEDGAPLRSEHTPGRISYG